MPDLSTRIDLYNQSLDVEIESGYFAKRLLVLTDSKLRSKVAMRPLFFIFKILPDQL